VHDGALVPPGIMWQVQRYVIAPVEAELYTYENTILYHWFVSFFIKDYITEQVIKRRYNLYNNYVFITNSL